MGAQAVPRVIQGHLQVCSLPGLLLKRMVGMWTLCDPSLPHCPPLLTAGLGADDVSGL